MVKNMDESLNFYSEIVGFKPDRRFNVGSDTEIAFLGDGETKVELICKAGKDNINVGKDISWGFEVDSLDEFMEFLKEKGVVIHSGPFQPNPKTRFFYVTDPNGLKIQFVESNKDD